MLKEIDELKESIDFKKPIAKTSLLSYIEDLALKWTYHSNAIEGNTLTLNETKVVLEGITIGGKQLREHFEIINHSEAIDYLLDIVRKKEEIKISTIKHLHYLMLKNINDDEAGKYREVPVKITGAFHTPPNSFQLDYLVNDVLNKYIESNEHPVVKAAIFHADFIGIHPFVDGNGRTGRLMLNLMLMLEGYKPIVIEVNDRVGYYDALDIACAKKQYDSIINLVSACQIKALKDYLAFLE